MNEFIKQNWFNIGILIILVLAIGGAFYWFQLKPSQIRKICQEKIEKQDRELLESATKNKILNGEGDIYDVCLRKYGLEK